MLKHMPPGPSSGQPRPPTRGLHQHGRPIQPLNVSTLSTPTQTTNLNLSSSTQPTKLIANGGPRHTNLLNSTPIQQQPTTNLNNNNNNNINHNNHNHNLTNGCNYTLNNHNSNNVLNTKHRIGAREALTSLGLLCLVSLLLALLSLIFLLKISPGGRELPPPPPGPTSPEDYIIVYDVTLALCALSLSLNLCCLLVCAIQFLFAVKLVRAPATSGRGNKYLQKSSVSRVCAVGGFFISIPIFLTGIILYTFTQFHSTPAIITSVLIGIGIVFCGGAMVHNVFVWQKEKTICVRNQPLNLQIATISTATTPGTPGTATTTTQQPPLPPLLSSLSGQFTNITNNNNHHLTSNGIIGNGNLNGGCSNNHLHMNHHHHHHHLNHNQQQQMTHTPLTHTSQHSQSQHSHVTALTPVTPISQNHSHVSFNHSYNIPTSSTTNYLVRAATATPPTPKVINTNTNNNTTMLGGSRDASGSVSPGMPPSTNNNNNNMDMSNVTSTSPHELSTLV